MGKSTEGVPGRITKVIGPPDGNNGGTGIAAVDQSGLAHCNGSGTTWITATALSGALNRFGDPALVRGTAQLNCP